MSRRDAKKRAALQKLREQFGQPPTPAESGKKLLAALTAPAMPAAAVATTPAEDPNAADEPIACDPAPDDGEAVAERTPAPKPSVLDDDVVALWIENAEARSGIDAWNEFHARRSEEDAELAELERQIAELDDGGEDEDGEDDEAGEAGPSPAAAAADPKQSANVALANDLRTAADYAAEWELHDPLTGGIASLPLRQLAELAHVGPILKVIANGGDFLDAFDARHENGRRLLAQIGTALAAEPSVPADLVTAATEQRVCEAFDRAVTVSTLRLPQEIRRVAVAFRQVRDRRSAPLRAISERSDSLERAHIDLDTVESVIRGSGPYPGLADIRRYGEILDDSDRLFRELADAEQSVLDVTESLQGHQTEYHALAGKSREATAAISQVRAAANLLRIILSETVAAQMDDVERKLANAPEAYAAEMGAEFDAPPRRMSVDRYARELDSRRAFLAALTKPRAQCVFQKPVADRDEEIRRLILIAYSVICDGKTTGGFGANTVIGGPTAVTESLMLRAGLILADEVVQARSLMMGTDAAEWRGTNLLYTKEGRNHLYCPTPAGFAAARSFLSDATDPVALAASIRTAKKERTIAFYAMRKAKSPAPDTATGT